MLFTKQHKSYEEWLDDHSENNVYEKRIRRLHNIYPGASLSQLRGHPKHGEVPLWMLKPRECTPEAISDFKRIAKDLTVTYRIFDYDAAGNIIPWRRPKDEPQ
jgi:hypothetical protein